MRTRIKEMYTKTYIKMEKNNSLYEVYQGHESSHD